jgi:hypothetical protein
MTLLEPRPMFAPRTGTTLRTSREDLLEAREARELDLEHPPPAPGDVPDEPSCRQWLLAPIVGVGSAFLLVGVGRGLGIDLPGQLGTVLAPLVAGLVLRASTLGQWLYAVIATYVLMGFIGAVLFVMNV